MPCRFGLVSRAGERSPECVRNSRAARHVIQLRAAGRYGRCVGTKRLIGGRINWLETSRSQNKRGVSRMATSVRGAAVERPDRLGGMGCVVSDRNRCHQDLDGRVGQGGFRTVKLGAEFADKALPAGPEIHPDLFVAQALDQTFQIGPPFLDPGRRFSEERSDGEGEGPEAQA
jgi:hypothetical protein